VTYNVRRLGEVRDIIVSSAWQPMFVFYF